MHRSRRRRRRRWEKKFRSCTTIDETTVSTSPGGFRLKSIDDEVTPRPFVSASFLGGEKGEDSLESGGERRRGRKRDKKNSIPYSRVSHAARTARRGIRDEGSLTASTSAAARQPSVYRRRARVASQPAAGERAYNIYPRPVPRLSRARVRSATNNSNIIFERESERVYAG